MKIYAEEKKWNIYDVINIVILRKGRKSRCFTEFTEQA